MFRILRKMPKHNDVGSKAPEVNELTSKTSGLLSPSSLALAAPQAATGIFKEKIWNADGNLVEYIGVRVPLYITDEIAEVLYIKWTGNLPIGTEIPRAGAKRADGKGYDKYEVKSNPIAESEIVSQIKSANQLSKRELTTDDLLYSMSRTKSGRLAMMSYRDSSDIFITSGGTNPIYVNSYYLKAEGVGAILASPGASGGYYIDDDVTRKSEDITQNMAAAATLSLRTRRT